MSLITNSFCLAVLLLCSSVYGSMADIQNMRDCALGVERSAIFGSMLKSQDTALSTPSEKGFYIKIDESNTHCRFTFLGEKSVDSVQLPRKSSRNGSSYDLRLISSGETFYVNVPLDPKQPCKASGSNDYGETKKRARATAYLIAESRKQFADFFRMGIIGQFVELTQIAVTKWNSSNQKGLALEIESAIKSCRQVKEFREEVGKVDRALTTKHSTGEINSKNSSGVN
jgi:hypothetical protein